MDAFDSKAADISVSYDRNSVTVRLYCKNAFDYYKECRRKDKDFYSADILEMPIGTVTPDGYYYSIRGKLSVKEFITGEETATPEMFYRLLLRTADAAELAGKHGIKFGDLVFDYNCVFLQNGGKDFVFIYMPGASLSVDNPGAGDLLSVVFINMDYDSLPQELYSYFKSSVDSLCFISDPVIFSESARRLADEIKAYIDTSQGFAKRLFKKFSGNQTNKKKISPEISLPKQSETVTAYVKTDNGTPVMALNKPLDRAEKLKIKIGRDTEWADLRIDNMFVSRRHAEVYIEDGRRIHVKDLSLNGTYVGGEKTTEEDVYDITEDGVQIDIGENCEIELRLNKKPA